MCVCVCVFHITFPKRARETAHHHTLPTHSLAGGVDRHGKGFMGKNTVFMGDSVRTRSSSTQTCIPILPLTHTHTAKTHIHGQTPNGGFLVCSNHQVSLLNLKSRVCWKSAVCICLLIYNPLSIVKNGKKH